MTRAVWLALSVALAAPGATDGGDEPAAVRFPERPTYGVGRQAGPLIAGGRAPASRVARGEAGNAPAPT